MPRKKVSARQSRLARLPEMVSPAGEASYPLRVACVDLGSNGIRFLAGEFSGPGQYRVLAAERAAVRLGRGAFRANRLEPRAMAAALQALAGFRRRMQVLDIRHHRWVATSAVRESANGAAFAERVRQRLGVELEIISGSEENRLVFAAVKSRMALGRRAWMLTNVGGGSVEVALADRTGVKWSQSHTMGAVRLLQELEGAGREAAPRRFRRLLSEYVASLRMPAPAGTRGLAGFIATGGNIEVLARLARAPLRPDGVALLPLAALRRVIAELAALSVPARIRRLGLKKDRADVILPAAVVYERLCLLAGQTRLWVPGVGTKEGILIDLADSLTAHAAHVREKEAQLLDAAVALGRRYRFDEAHSLHVGRLAVSLFAQLRPVHGLGEADGPILLAAAVLHDIGTYISYKKHHKHTLYLLSQSELPGLNPDEMLMAANVARYHRKSGPERTHEYYMRLPEAARGRVARLASLLRLADALDREHAQNVRSLRVRIGAGRLDLILSGEGDPEIVRWAVKRKAELFTRLFGLKVRVEHQNQGVKTP